MSIQGSADKIIRDLRVVNKQVQVAASTSALNKTNDRINTRAKRQIASAVGIPQKLFAPGTNKGAMRKYKATYRKQRARTWFGLRKKIPVRKVVRNAKGIGKFAHYTKSTMHGKTAADVFLAKMPTGHEGLFVRKGRERLPIQEVKLDLTNIANSTINRVGEAIGEETFRKEFTRELKRRANARNGIGYRRFN